MKLHIWGLALLLVGLFLAACGEQPTPVDVAPPVVPTTEVPVELDAGDLTDLPVDTPAPGLPGPVVEQVAAVYQRFERGHAIWLADRLLVWVFIQPTLTVPDLPLFVPDDVATPEITPTPFPDVVFGAGGPWYQFNDTFDAAVDLDTDPEIVPPADRQQPKGGIGKVWRSDPVLQAALGWAMDWEQSYTAQLVTYPLGYVQAGNVVTTGTVRSITTADNVPLYIYANAGVWSLTP